MNATIQGVFVMAYFVAPGFVHYYFTRAFGVASDADPSDLQLLVRSLCGTLVLLAAEATAIVLLAILWPGLKDQLQLLVADGLPAYADQHPVRLLGCATGVLGFNLAVGTLAGYRRFPDKQIESRLRQVGLTHSPAWTAILTSDEELINDVNEANATKGGSAGRRTYRAARIRMKSGAVYAGFVASFDVRSRKDGTRDIAIWRAHYAPPPEPGKGTPPLATLPPSAGGNAVIVNTREISSVEIFYVPAED